MLVYFVFSSICVTTVLFCVIHSTMYSLLCMSHTHGGAVVMSGTRNTAQTQGKLILCWLNILNS